MTSVSSSSSESLSSAPSTLMMTGPAAYGPGGPGGPRPNSAGGAVDAVSPMSLAHHDGGSTYDLLGLVRLVGREVLVVVLVVQVLLGLVGLEELAWQRPMQ